MVSKFLITGGEGFIGRNLKSLIMNNGDDVRTLDIDGKPDYHMSITDIDSIMGIDEKFDGIFHLASTTSPPIFEEDPVEGFKVNSNGTLNVLEFAKRKKIKKVVMASSSAVYGDSREISSESTVPDIYSNLYPITKLLDEHLGRYYSVRNEVECISLRYFNTFGPDENSKGKYSSQISKFVKSALLDEPIIIYGNGTQSRDFIYVKDIARATWLAFLNGKAGESYNVGTGISTEFNEIAETVKRIALSKSEIKHIPNPLRSYQMFTQADMMKSHESLDFTPEYDLKRGISEMVDLERE